MNLKTSIKLLYILVLLVCLSTSVVSAAPRPKQAHYEGFSWQDARLNIDLSWGAIPYGKLSRFFDADFKLDTSFNYAIRVLAGYSLPIFENSKLGFEAGCGYGFSRTIKNTEFNGTLADNHLMIPLQLTYYKPLETSFYCAHTTIIGYEFDIIVSSLYKQSDYYPNLHPTFQGDKDVIDFLPDFPRLSGNIVFSDRYDFPKGIYAALTVRVPIQLFTIFKEAKNADAGLTSTYVKLMRLENTNWIELTVGVNVIDWIYPREEHQSKSSYRKR
jgi:hypothetical protein